jgi:hypothetical protein
MMGRSKWSVVGLALVVGVLAAVGALLIGGVGSASADEVRFQNVSDPGPKPFTAPAMAAKSSGGSALSDSAGSGSSTDSTETSTTESASGGGENDTESSSTETNQEGTFGGSGKKAVCDREKLIRELAADPEKLSAWADTVGIEANEEAVGEYIRKLRPVTLTQDTQVTNHSYSGGSAEPYQAILEKGTAVLVDKDGKPVTRCACGNPLAEPVELEENTKCYDCPPNYQPPPPCEYYDYDDTEYDSYSDSDYKRTYKRTNYTGKCYRPETDPPPVKKPGEHDWSATDLNREFEDCVKQKGGTLECGLEYQRVIDQCNRELSKGQSSPECDLYCNASETKPGEKPCKSALDPALKLKLCRENPGALEESECASAKVDLEKQCQQNSTLPDCKELCNQAGGTQPPGCPKTAAPTEDEQGEEETAPEEGTGETTTPEETGPGETDGGGGTEGTPPEGEATTP